MKSLVCIIEKLNRQCYQLSLKVHNKYLYYSMTILFIKYMFVIRSKPYGIKYEKLLLAITLELINIQHNNSLVLKYLL